jgi:hypothetical protein
MGVQPRITVQRFYLTLVMVKGVKMGGSYSHYRKIPAYATTAANFDHAIRFKRFGDCKR